MKLKEIIKKVLKEEINDIKKSPLNGVDKKLVDIFYRIQSDYGKPLQIKSAARDKKTNDSSGGAKNSAHLRGKAIDIKFDTPNREGIKKLIKLATKYGILGIGVYRDAQDLHIDIDETLGKRAWGPDYTSNSIPSWAKEEISQHLKQNKKETKEEELTEKCWKGYTQKGMKTMFGKRYPNCVKKTK